MPITRFVFAGVSLSIFLGALVSLVFQSGWIGIVLFAIFTVAVGLALMLNGTVRGLLGRIINAGIRTNNRWWLAMLALTVFSFGIALIGTQYWGTPISALEYQDSPGLKSAYELMSKRGRDYELFEVGAAPDPATRITQPHRSWLWWLYRWVALLYLALATFVYTFFAFIDEARLALRAADRMLHERTGGTTRGSLFRQALNRLFGIVPVGPAQPTGGTTAPQQPPAAAPEQHATAHIGSWIAIFLMSFLAEILGERHFGRH